MPDQAIPNFPGTLIVGPEDEANLAKFPKREKEVKAEAIVRIAEKI